MANKKHSDSENMLADYLYDESDSITIKEARKRLKN